MYRLQVWPVPLFIFSPPVNTLLVSRHTVYRAECTCMHHVCTSLNVCVLSLTWLTQGLLCFESAFGHFPINRAGISFVGSLRDVRIFLVTQISFWHTAQHVQNASTCWELKGLVCHELIERQEGEMAGGENLPYNLPTALWNKSRSLICRELGGQKTKGQDKIRLARGQ